MVIRPQPSSLAKRGMLTAELVVAMALLTIALLPLGYSYLTEARLLRADYHRAIAMEIVDGEMEILAAGEWRAFPEGAQAYAVHAAAAGNLPPGQFRLTRTGNRLLLEWAADRHRGIGIVKREVTVQ
jgi:hypothetical protein